MAFSRAARANNAVPNAGPFKVASPRQLKVAKAIHRVLTEYLASGALRSKPLNGGAALALTDVHVTSNLQLARVRWEPLTDDVPTDLIAKALGNLRGHLQSHVNDHLRQRIHARLEFELHVPQHAKLGIHPETMLDALTRDELERDQRRRELADSNADDRDE
jgi:ribosome-binding factor A